MSFNNIHNLISNDFVVSTYYILCGLKLRYQGSKDLCVVSCTLKMFTDKFQMIIVNKNYN